METADTRDLKSLPYEEDLFHQFIVFFIHNKGVNKGDDKENCHARYSNSGATWIKETSHWKRSDCPHSYNRKPPCDMSYPRNKHFSRKEKE
jgi:hypothetical protein